MTGRINKENKTITELPTMVKPHPVIDDADDSEYWGKKVREYQNRLASLRTFPYSGEWKAETGDTVSFELLYQYLNIDTAKAMNCVYLDCNKEAYELVDPNFRRVIAIPLPDKQPDEKEHKEDIPLTGSIKKLADAMEAKGVRPVFGLQPDQIKLIEETFKDQPDLFNERLWEQVGKKISWYPLTAMCWYMKHLAKEKAHKQESEDPLSKLPERPPLKEFLNFLEGENKFYVEEVRYWSNLMMNEQVSFSRFVELFNEKLFKLTQEINQKETKNNQV